VKTDLSGYLYQSDRPADSDAGLQLPYEQLGCVTRSHQHKVWRWTRTNKGVGCLLTRRWHRSPRRLHGMPARTRCLAWARTGVSRGTQTVLQREVSGGKMARCRPVVARHGAGAVRKLEASTSGALWRQAAASGRAKEQQWSGVRIAAEANGGGKKAAECSQWAEPELNEEVPDSGPRRNLYFRI
jgi:hypothetical protein